MIDETHISCEEATRIRIGWQSGKMVDGFDSAEMRAMKAHLQNCDNCRMDNAIQRLMEKNTSGVSDMLKRKRRIADAIVAARQSEATTVSDAQKNNSWRGILLAATLLTGIGLGGAIFGGWAKDSASDARPVTKKDVAAAAEKPDIPQTVLDSERSTGHSQSIDAAVGFADVSHIGMRSGVDVFLDSDTRMAVRQSDEALLRVSIERGSMLVSVDPSVPHPLVEVVTSEGVVAVKGTVFTVSATPKVEVSVLRGVVEATHGTVSTRVSAGHHLVFKTGEVRSLGKDEMSELARVEEYLQADSAEVLSVPNEISVMENTGETLPPAPSLDETNADAHPPMKPDLEKEMNQIVLDARSKRHRGDYKGALKKYEEVIALSPASRAAATSHIAAGNIQLRLGDAASALNHFSSYLSGPSTSLRQEAMFGKIKAFRQMKDYDNELRASREFIAQWPNSVHVESIRDKVFHLEILAGIPSQ